MKSYFMRCPDILYVRQIIEKGYSMGYVSYESDLEKAVDNYISWWNSYKERTIIYFEEDGRISYSSISWLNDNRHKVGDELIVIVNIFDDNEDFLL